MTRGVAILWFAVALLLPAEGSAQPAVADAVCSATMSGDQTRTYRVRSADGNDTAQIQCAIDLAIKDLQTKATQSATVLLEPKATYHLHAPTDFFDALAIKTSDLEKRTFASFTLNGQDAVMVLDPLSTGIYLNGCQDCILENFTIRTEPNPMREGILINATPTSADVRITSGQTFSVTPNYRPIVGKNARVAIFRIADDQAFPTRHRFPNKVPLVLMTSATSPSADIVRIASDNSPLLVRLPLNATSVSLISPPVDPAKEAAMTDVLSRAEVTRREHPEYGPQFFTGNRVAALFAEQNTNLTVRNVTISDFAGQAIHASYNRGPLRFDRISIVPSAASGIRSLGAAGFAARNNQIGPRITNSIIVNPGDDSIDITNVPFNGRNVQGNSAELIAPGTLLQSISVSAGDRFDIVDTATGRSLGKYTVATATPFVLNARAYGYRVTFTTPLPTGIVPQESANPTTFINLDQTNTGAVIRGNLIMGGERNGVIISSSGVLEHNAFVGLGLWAIQYLPLLVNSKPRTGHWGDLGPVVITGNTAIDVNFGLLRTTNTGKSSSYGVSLGGLTVSQNTVVAPANGHAHYSAIYLNNPTRMPTRASGNTLILSAGKPSVPATGFIVGGDIAGWESAFAVKVARGPADLWRAKCEALSSSPQWLAALKAIAPGAC